jgi:hypothetical protein
MPGEAARAELPLPEAGAPGPRTGEAPAPRSLAFLSSSILGSLSPRSLQDIPGKGGREGRLGSRGSAHSGPRPPAPVLPPHCPRSCGPQGRRKQAQGRSPAGPAGLPHPLPLHPIPSHPMGSSWRVLPWLHFVRSTQAQEGGVGLATPGSPAGSRGGRHWRGCPWRGWWRLTTPLAPGYLEPGWPLLEVSHVWFGQGQGHLAVGEKSPGDGTTSGPGTWQRSDIAPTSCLCGRQADQARWDSPDPGSCSGSLGVLG